MKVSHLFSCLAAGLALAACRDNGPTFVTQAPQAYVRFVNASPDSPNVTARFVDKVENMFTWDRVGFRGQSGNYIAVNAGPRNLRVFLSGQGNSTTIDSASTILLDTTGIELQPQTYYTMVMTGRVLPRRGAAGNNAVMRVFVDSLLTQSTIDTASIRVRAYHVAEGTGPVDVVFNKRVIIPADTTATPPRPTETIIDSATAGTISNVAFGARSAYLALPRVRPADTLNLYRALVRPAGTTTNLITARPNVPGLAFTAASISGPALDPVGGVRQGRSVLSVFVFPAAIAGTPARIAATANPTVDVLIDQSPPRP